MTKSSKQEASGAEAVVDELIALERTRCRALVEKDFETIRRIISKDVVHVHTRGNVDSFDSYMAYIQNVLEFLNVERHDLEVKVLGGTAIMTGGQTNTARLIGGNDIVKVKSRAIQVWMRQADGAWQQVAFQASLVGPPPPAMPAEASSAPPALKP